MRRLVLLAAVACGCGGPAADDPLAVSGTVTHAGRPVAEGVVQFAESATGRGAEAAIGPDGRYTARLPAGTYQVAVLPPTVESDPNAGLPNPTFKKVKDIPEKYRSAATSGLTAVVAAGRTTHDFALAP
jgi:hypothetical protein